jgi:hypothetical protein
MVKLRRMKWAEHVARMGAGEGDRERNACRVLVGKSEGWRQLGRSRCRWEK